jgi:hypothetical protein
MIIHHTSSEIKELLINPSNWSKFLDFYYYLQPNLAIRSVTGSKAVEFKVDNLQNDNIIITVTRPKYIMNYHFQLSNVDETTELILTTSYQIPQLENMVLKLMGINITPDSDAILNNISHYLEHGHVH